MFDKQRLKWLLNSTFGLLLAFAFVLLLQWLLLLTGKTVSHFQGQIQWNGFDFHITARHWNFYQVMALYLFPELVFVLLFIFFPWRPKFPVKTPEILQLFLGWTGLILLVKTFFIPFADVFYHRNLFFALSWSGFSRPFQYGIVIMAMMIFLINIFVVSAVFSPLLPSFADLSPGKKLLQLLFLWYLPFGIWAGCIYFFSGNHFFYPVNFLLIGMGLVLMVNTPYIMSYRVIVR